MSAPLPHFRYHPDPLANGSLVAADGPCQCCGQARGYLYALSPYGTHDLGTHSLCPWCIADGSAAEKLQASFNDDYPLLEAGVPESVLAEVCDRTPGYASWQQEHWLSCCNDACAFLGDAPRDTLQALGAEGLAEYFVDYPWPASAWQDLLKGYQPGGNPAVYRFGCLHCGRDHYALDFT
ncbi:MAG: hypothetical protein GAK45_00468 [Pseudomonas citronellolis]|nr:MAG: hypothetical protein GAK45_00468 [Pseudomonas citronellolis]